MDQQLPAVPRARPESEIDRRLGRDRVRRHDHVAGLNENIVGCSGPAGGAADRDRFLHLAPLQLAEFHPLQIDRTVELQERALRGFEHDDPLRHVAREIAAGKEDKRAGLEHDFLVIDFVDDVLLEEQLRLIALEHDRIVESPGAGCEIGLEHRGPISRRLGGDRPSISRAAILERRFDKRHGGDVIGQKGAQACRENRNGASEACEHTSSES